MPAGNVADALLSPVRSLVRDLTRSRTDSRPTARDAVSRRSDDASARRAPGADARSGDPSDPAEPTATTDASDTSESSDSSVIVDPEEPTQIGAVVVTGEGPVFTAAGRPNSED